MLTNNEWKILPNDVPIFSDIYLWNYDSMFKTKEVISSDRARFAQLGQILNDWVTGRERRNSIPNMV